jgi:hypothetical protein
VVEAMSLEMEVVSIAGIYNRLVIWDASLIHSAESYEEFTEDPRLVHLHFFNVAKPSGSDVVA